MMQVVVIALLVGMVWFAVKGVKEIKGKYFKRGLKFLGLSVASFLVIGIISGIMANTPEAKQQAAQEQAKQEQQIAQKAQEKAQKAQVEAKKKAEEEAKKAQEEAFRNSPEGKYQEWVNSRFDPWNGSAISLVDTVKKQMHDPSSFKHVETTYTDKGNMKGIDVYMTFRGTNGFGGIVTNRVHASYDYNTKLFTYEMI